MNTDEATALLLKNDLYTFVRWFFAVRENADLDNPEIKWMRNDHQKLICDALMRVHSGETQNLIINMPPGAGKTDICVVAFIAWCFGIYSGCRFIHTSFSDDLVQANSRRIKSGMNNEYYQRLFPETRIAGDKGKANKNTQREWDTTGAGYFYCAPLLGGITGRRAGSLANKDKFSGAIIIDDPQKPEDCFSVVKRERANRVFINTLKSRKAHTKVPVIVIMQRLHCEDVTSFLLDGGMGLEFEQLIIKGVEDEGTENERSYWEDKDSLEELSLTRASSPYTFHSQYQQDPAPLGGGLFKTEWLQPISEEDLPAFEYTAIFCDTAQKTAEYNDFSVFQFWGKVKGKNEIVLLNQMRGKWEAHDLEKNFVIFYKRCDENAPAHLRTVYVEDKSSGTGLIQKIKKEKEIPIEGIQRDVDKVTRAMDAIPWFALKSVYYLDNKDNAEWIPVYLSEMLSFNAEMTHSHDDQVDPTLDATDKMLFNTKRKIDWV